MTSQTKAVVPAKAGTQLEMREPIIQLESNIEARNEQWDSP